ncbi:unnamed protein product [Rotaria socialis]|uniref:Uncharacterized protein n=1 Tax=Rotaria socialis TaxID=392032 RepID=A0A820Y923_9BILA|nr:unnamed protein product [Rotaria socialis]CAF4523092.1 unnamed protein product [Rotaria socialis]CAF4546406.1 unnamed protein product [Rotaria socialis]CAF4657683.1 unnamed protein product [Rotaria socialis]CAF4667885.1 unnamed protein product [Rotaria socialis]
MRKKQLNIFEDLTIFEQRILCHTLPKTFDGIPIATYQNLFENEANKIMQELKRRKLNDQLNNYELGLQHYEDLYQTKLKIFESKLIDISLNHQYTQADILMTLLKCYLSHYTNRLYAKFVTKNLKTGNYILRETDKSGIFHVGHSHSADYEKKAEAYRQKTGAYIELDSNPS